MFVNQYDKEEKRYKLNYYLADNSLEICETKENNSRKDPFPYLLLKIKLPKKAYLPYITENEIVDCDAYIKQWYKNNFGIYMQPIKFKRPQRVIHTIPEYKGFGNEEDSLMNVFYLDPSGKIHEYYLIDLKEINII